MRRGPRRRRAGALVTGLLAIVALASMITLLATQRGSGEPTGNSAVIAAVPPLTGARGPIVSVGALATGPPGSAVAAPGGGQLPTGAWPVPPADPSAAVDAAIAEAAAQGVRLAVVVVDRPTGSTLVRRDADEPFPALSLLKLMIAADVLGNGWPDGGDTTTGGPAAPTGSASAQASDTADTADPDDDAGLPVVDDQAQVDAVLTRMIATSDDVLAGDLYDAAGADEMVDRVAVRYGLTGTSPTPDGEYWGNVQVTASDMATLLTGVLADPATGAVIGPAMRATTVIAADGVEQRFGMGRVPGAGSKQGWGCCLSGEVGIHTMGFTDDRIVVVLSAAEPDDDTLGEQDGLALQADPAAQASFDAVSATVRAALGGPGG